MSLTKVTSNVINDVDASKLTGSIADARVPSSAVTQHSDTSSIENDIAVLALHQAINENKSAHNLANTFIEQFEDSNSITALTNCSRDSSEYVSSVTSDHGVTMGYQHNFSNSLTPQTNTLSAGTIDLNSGAFTASGRTGYGVQYPNARTSTSEGLTISGMSNALRSYSYWFKITGNTDGYLCDFRAYGSGHRGDFSATDYINNTTGSSVNLSTLSTTAWHHGVFIQTSGNPSTGITLNSRYAAENGTFWSNGIIIDNFEIYDGTLSSSQVATIYAYEGELGGSFSATGSFTSTTITPQDSASKSSLGLVILYKNNAGTNTLNTDIIAKVSADNGSNYSTCVLASKGTFSTGINIAIAPAISVTAGTQLKYKIEFANQASGSKEGQIHGVALSY